MRIIVKGNSSTEELADVFDCLIARLTAAGIDEVSGVNIYLTPIIAGTPAIFVPDRVTPDERLELVGGVGKPDILEEGMDRVITPGKFVAKHEFYQEHSKIYAWQFCQRMNVSPGFYKKFLGMTSERAKEVFCSVPPVEISSDERPRLAALIEFTRSISKVFPHSNDSVAWFRGPYPDSRFEGATPIEQIELGGPQVAFEIAKALTLGVRRRRRGRDLPWPPPAHFDRIFLRASLLIEQ